MFMLVRSCMLSYPTNLCAILGFDVNYVNDIGQSLLNWATAVGSEKQVSCVDQLPIAIDL